MKKYYIQPRVVKERIEAMNLLSGSEVKSNNGIGFGGVDNNGSADPDANSNSDLWSDED